MVCNCKSPINGQLMSFWEISLKKKKIGTVETISRKKEKKNSKKATKIVSTNNSEILGGSLDHNKFVL